VYLLFLHPNGTVKAEQKISDTAGNSRGWLGDNDRFGCSVAGLGDIDGDATQDISVGAQFDDDGGNGKGAVYVLFLNLTGNGVTTGAGDLTTGAMAVSSTGATPSTGAVFSTTGVLPPPPGSDIAVSSDVSSSGSMTLILVVAGGGAALCLVVVVVVAVVVVRRQRLSDLSAATSATSMRTGSNSRSSDSSSDASSSGGGHYAGFSQVVAGDAGGEYQTRNAKEDIYGRPFDDGADNYPVEDNYQTPDFSPSVENPYNAL
jgi:FG-GAP repeat